MRLLVDKRVHRTRSRNIAEGVNMGRGYKSFCRSPTRTRDDWTESAKDQWGRKDAGRLALPLCYLRDEPFFFRPGTMRRSPEAQYPRLYDRR